MFKVTNNTNSAHVMVAARTERGARIKGSKLMGIPYAWTGIAEAPTFEVRTVDTSNWEDYELATIAAPYYVDFANQDGESVSHQFDTEAEAIDFAHKIWDDYGVRSIVHHYILPTVDNTVSFEGEDTYTEAIANDLRAIVEGTDTPVKMWNDYTNLGGAWTLKARSHGSERPAEVADWETPTAATNWVSPDRVIDGVPYMRSFVADLLPGEVTPFNEVVSRVDYLGSDRYRVSYTNGFTTTHGATGTILIKITA